MFNQHLLDMQKVAKVANYFNDFTSLADTIRSNTPPNNHHFSGFLRNCHNPNSIPLPGTSTFSINIINFNFSINQCFLHKWNLSFNSQNL